MQVLWQDFPLWALWAPALLWQLYFVFRYWWPVVWRRDAWKEAPGAAASKPLSLVIAARNEADNLRRNLPVWMAQTHPDFEVVVVDDGSTDNSLEILKQYHSQITLIQTKKIGRFPIVLVGTEFWSGLLEWIKKTLIAQGNISEEDLKLFRIVDTAEEAVAHLNKFYSKYY